MNYINQAPKELKAMKVAFRKNYVDVQAVADSGDYYLQPKYDGVHGVAIMNSTPKMVSRDNKQYHSCQHIIDELVQLTQGARVVVFGELYAFDTPQRTISGWARSHSPQPQLYFVVFDIVPYEDFLNGVCTTPYDERYIELKARLQRRGLAPSVLIASNDEASGIRVNEFAASLKKRGGYDGAILIRKDSPWVQGACNDGSIIKIKPTISLDLKVVGVLEGEGKYVGTAGALIVEYKGVRSKVGTGFTDDDRHRWWALQHSVKAGNYIVEVECMEVTDAGALREPRYKGERFDKSHSD